MPLQHGPRLTLEASKGVRVNKKCKSYHDTIAGRLSEQLSRGLDQPEYHPIAYIKRNGKSTKD